MSNCILDLVTRWEPNQYFPEMRQFETKFGVQGYAVEDGESMLLLNCFAARPGMPRLALFFNCLRNLYQSIFVIEPYGSEFIPMLISLGFVPCSIRRNVGEKKWLPGVIWQRDHFEAVILGSDVASIRVASRIIKNWKRSRALSMEEQAFLGFKPKGILL